MARIPLITAREGLDPDQAEAFDLILESRGEVLRPFQVLLHRPALARTTGDLGATIRFASHLADADRELIILATAAEHGCAFEWDHHLPIARAAGVRPAVIEELAGRGGDLQEREAVLVAFCRELCRTSHVSGETFAAVRDLLGDAGVVELAATVGYYTMLGYVMSSCEAC